MNPDKQPAVDDFLQVPANKARCRRTSKSSGGGHRYRLACPFGVKDNCPNQGPGFENIARMKSSEHLKRYHGPLGDGATGPETAATGSTQASQGRTVVRLTEGQKERILHLPRDFDSQRKWETIYGIIFPNEPVSKAAFVLTAELLQDYACDPPAWLFERLMDFNGESHAETYTLLKKIFTFCEIASGRLVFSPLWTITPPLTQQSSTGTSSFGNEPSSSSGMSDMYNTPVHANERDWAVNYDSGADHGNLSQFSLDLNDTTIGR